uniref:Uncharacterized protein n=1 Tax=Eucampia antarctica TaxID=49252 RepID=A0A7S2WRS0_9STRA
MTGPPPAMGFAALPPRISNLFDNPDRKASPVPAKATSCMTSKDILTVVHASLRPLYAMMHYVNNPQQGGTVSHHADFYHLQFTKQQQQHSIARTNTSHNGIILPHSYPSPPSTNNNSKNSNDKKEQEQQEQREQIALREQKFVVTTEKRAMDWSKNQQTLGQMVKTNVYRPRALLSVPTVVRKPSDDDNSNNNNNNNIHDTDDNSQPQPPPSARTNLWKARLLTDRGYNAMLELIELRTIFAAPTNNKQDDDQRREHYLPQVQRHIDTLHKTFGMHRPPNNNNNTNNNSMLVNSSVLALTLSVPKGRTLLARLLHLAILPHDSAALMLPTLCQTVFHDYHHNKTNHNNNNNNNNIMNHPYARLLQAIVGLVRTVHPSVQRDELISSLDNIQADPNFIQTIANSRPHMELLHAILTRCQQICPPHDMEWKQKEQAILAKLSAT